MAVRGVAPYSVCTLHRAISILACLVAMLALAAPASAVVTTTPGVDGLLGIESNGDGDTIVVTCVEGKVFVNGNPTVNPCALVAVLQVEGNGGNDAIDLSAVGPAAFPALTRSIIVGGGATDSLFGSQFGDEIASDTVDSVEGGGGNDWIVEGKQVNGGVGNDVLNSTQGSADGGPGDDHFGELGTGSICRQRRL